MMPRRSFLCRALIAAAGLAAKLKQPAADEADIPHATAHVRGLTLWIADSEPGVALAVQLLARHCGLADTHIFESKELAIRRLRAGITKPTLLVTDYWSSQM